MKMNLRKALLGVVAPALATLVVAAASWSMSGSEAPRHDPQQKVSHLAKMLQLTEEQEVSVKTLLMASFEESEADHERLRALRAELLDQPESFVEATAQSAADEIGQITSRMVYRMASTRAAIYQLLDDEQRLAMNEMDEWSGKRGDKRHGHQRPPF